MINKKVLDFIIFLKNLNKEKWKVKVNSKWNVQDVVAHLVGWEEEAVKALKEQWKTKEKPWFMKTYDYDEFNERNVNKYSKLSIDKLLIKWKYFQDNLKEKIGEIGEDKLRNNPDFSWVFDEAGESHYLLHVREIKLHLSEILLISDDCQEFTFLKL